MAKISKNIKRLRTNANMSQDEMAQKLFISRQAVSSWETGRTQPDIEMIGKLAELFEVPTEELIYGEKRNTALAESVKTKKNISVVFAVLGSFLVGIGLMIILIGLWEEFSNIFKSIVSLIPLIIGQVVAIFVYRKKFESEMWREGGAILWSTGVIATVGLMSMVNRLYLGVATCLMIDAILILPIIYFFRVVSPLALYYSFSIYGVVGVVDSLALSISPTQFKNFSFIISTLLFIMLIAAGVFSTIFNKKKLSPNTTDISMWFSVFAVIAAIVFNTLEYENFGTIFLLCPAVYALTKKDSWFQPFYPFGVAGTCIASLAATYISQDFYDYEEKFSTSILDVNFFGGIILSVAVICVCFILGRKNFKDDYLKLAFCICGSAIGITYNLIEIPLVALFATVAIFVLTFAEGVILIIKGAVDKRYFTMNTGIITLLVLLFQILSLIDFTMVTAGLMLLLSGGSLLGANVYISKQIKKDQAELAARAVEEDE